MPPFLREHFHTVPDSLYYLSSGKTDFTDQGSRVVIVRRYVFWQAVMINCYFIINELFSLHLFGFFFVCLFFFVFFCFPQNPLLLPHIELSFFLNDSIMAFLFFSFLLPSKVYFNFSLFSYCSHLITIWFILIFFISNINNNNYHLKLYLVYYIVVLLAFLKKASP